MHTATLLFALASSDFNRFSQFFHSQNQEKSCYNTITKDSITLQVCRCTTLWNVSDLTAATENEEI